MNNSYLTPNQVAELLMVTPAAVRQWAKKGELNALVTPGGHRRFIPSDIEHFARKRDLTLNPTNRGALRVLIVDDDEQVTLYLEALFDGCQEDVVTEIASDGFGAGVMVTEFEPHIILLDLMMPGLNGFDVCRRLKSKPDTKAIRIIAMTGFPSQDNVDNILSAGAEICFSKPFNKKLLFDHLGLAKKARI